MILLRYIEARARLHRLLSILKMRASGFDQGVREFVIGPRGIDLAETFDSAQMLLLGSIVDPSSGPLHPSGPTGG
jgi:circadian clock protein KaiC